MRATTRNNSIILTITAIIPQDQQDDGYDADKFAALKVREGDKSRDFFTPSMQSMNELLELSKMITLWGAKQTYEYLVNDVIPTLEEMYEAGTPQRFSVLIFNSPLLENERLNEEVLAAMHGNGQLTDTASCMRCGESKVYKKMAQTRSADEGMTAIFTCPRCGFGWNEG